MGLQADGIKIKFLIGVHDLIVDPMRIVLVQQAPEWAGVQDRGFFYPFRQGEFPDDVPVMFGRKDLYQRVYLPKRDKWNDQRPCAGAHQNIELHLRLLFEHFFKGPYGERSPGNASVNDQCVFTHETVFNTMPRGP